MGLAHLKQIIDREKLPVKKNVGGNSKRSLDDIRADIRAARSGQPPAVDAAGRVYPITTFDPSLNGSISSHTSPARASGYGVRTMDASRQSLSAGSLRLDNLDELDLESLKHIVEQEGLTEVKKNVGGPARRTLDHIRMDIRAARNARAAHGAGDAMPSAQISSSRPDVHVEAAHQPAGSAVLQQAGQAVSRILNWFTEPRRTRSSTTQANRNVLQELLRCGLLEHTPSGDSIQLKSYQFEGVLWMLHQEQRASSWKGGILADEMGLGKTLQLLSLMVLRPCVTLLICPATAFKSWTDDVDKFFAPRTFNIIDMRLLKKRKQRLPQQLPANTLVMINPESLPYDIFEPEITELPPESKHSVARNALALVCSDDLDHLGLNDLEARARTRGIDLDTLYTAHLSACKKEERSENPLSQLLAVPWDRIVCDEAQFLKNLSASPKGGKVIAKACMKLCASQPCIRWCLTGTPVENCAGDLLSLLMFMRATPYCDRTWFSQHFKANIYEEDERQSNAISQCFADTFLRRTKGTVAKDSLPKKHMSFVKVQMSAEELEVEEKVLEEDSSNCHLVKYLRSAQAAGNQVVPSCLAHLEVNEESTLADIQASAKRSIKDGGLGCELNYPGGGDENAARTWCLEKYRFERAWIEADKAKLLQGGKWKALKQLLKQIWEGGHEHEFAVQPPHNEEAGVWETMHGVYTKALDTTSETKVVIISRLGTRAFELVESLLAELRVDFERIDQTVPVEQRSSAINKFNNCLQTKVMLLGMKAGGQGINLQTAQVAILLDCWWNPAAEQQAIDRVHRVTSPWAHNYFFKLHVEDNLGDQKCYDVQKQKVAIRENTVDRAANVGAGRYGP
eukprot:gnl/MRDRNA2_/MRDRNA2_85936_c0_seq2.p1 gnl/MRDRNA2_/MRDRNA2_85936_c0~~gnl/MRDRNA2_/MRDRNA2_85936_c0_seq2.p1  ORF type:complete len:888 (-),score=166.32 gnl/MRDRNA2_/MRDRNA2_85936_c0_seq2:176-2731(-)